MNGIKLPKKGDKGNGGKIKLPVKDKTAGSKKGTNSVGMDDATAAKLDILSKRTGMSKTAIVRYLIERAE